MHLDVEYMGSHFMRWSEHKLTQWEKAGSENKKDKSEDTKLK